MQHDKSILNAGAWFNDKVPCECGLEYCDGWVTYRTRSRHKATVQKQAGQAENQNAGMSIRSE